MTTKGQLLALAASVLYTSSATGFIVLSIGNIDKDKGKGFPFHVMKAHRWRRSIAPLIPKSCTT
jgi:hypothetical protein